MRTVALDLDGTLIDSMPALEDIAFTLGIDRDDYRATTGRPFAEQVKLITGEPQPDMVAEFEDHKRQLYKFVGVFPGTLDALAKLSPDSWLVIASSTELELTARIIQRTGIAACVDYIGVGTKAEIVSRCDVFYGDSRYDGELATDLGVSFVLVGAGGLGVLGI